MANHNWDWDRSGPLHVMESIYSPDEKTYWIPPLLESTVESYRSFNPDFLSFIDIFTKIEYLHFQISAGEGSSGGNGFVWVKNWEKNRTEWVAFFHNSNPFVDLDIANNSIIANSNLNISWFFPLL